MEGFRKPVIEAVFLEFSQLPGGTYSMSGRRPALWALSDGAFAVSRVVPRLFVPDPLDRGLIFLERKIEMKFKEEIQ